MAESKILKFELSSRNLKIKKTLNQDFLEVEMKAISSANPNRNGSYFTKESMEKAIPTFYNKPILASFNVKDDDFRGHEGTLKYDPELDQAYYDYTDTGSETPLGLIRSEDKVEIVHDEIDNLDWIKFSCALWVKYGYKQIKRLLKSRNGQKKISVEIEVVNGYIDDNGVEVITEFIFDGVTILSDRLETGIADAELTILDQINNALFQKKQRCLAYAYGSLNEKMEKENEEIPNEQIDEISMSQEGGDNKMLTYGQKREILENFLNHAFENNESPEDATEDRIYVWVSDLDETFVYFQVNSDTFRASYTITESEDGDVAVVDLENKEKVIRSWQKFEESSMAKEDPEKKEIEACDGEKVMAKEENPAEEDLEKKETETCDEKEENMAKEEDPAKEDPEKKEAESCEGKEIESVSVGDKTFTVEELVSAYSNVSEQFTSLTEKYTVIETELNKYKEAEKQALIDSMITFGCSLVNSEDGLEDDEKTALNNQITENCKAEKFSDEKEVKEFAIDNIAVALYTKKLNGEKKVQKDFSIPFVSVKDNAGNKEKNGIKKLQTLNKNLEKI